MSWENGINLCVERLDLLTFHYKRARAQKNLHYDNWVQQRQINLRIWAATWQNQQTYCVPSEDSDHPGHLPSLIRVFAVRVKNLGSLATHWAHREDSDQTGWMPRLIWVFAGRTLILLVLSWGGSYAVWIRTFILMALGNIQSTQANTLLRLCRYAGCIGSSLGAHHFVAAQISFKTTALQALNFAWTVSFTDLTNHIWAKAWQNQQNDLCAQWRLRSALASALSD